MKKFIYISLVLIGIISIGSNFIVDSNKIDHKTVNASETSCKWISESGYGVGPHYVTPKKFQTTYWSTSEFLDIDFSDISSTSNINLLSCDLTNANTTKDGYRLYDNLGNPYTSEMIPGDTKSRNKYVYICAHNVPNNISNRYCKFLKIEDGYIINSTSDRDGKVNAEDEIQIYDSWITSGKDEAIFEEGKKIFARYHSYSYAETGYFNETLSEYPTDINGDGEWTFTCVCAEY